jgi:EmrB/QacA subfamily drug resistance transporter
MAMLDAAAVATALTTIRADLGASLAALEWTMNAYNLSFAVLLLTGAALGDRFGRRRMFILGIGLFVAASAACALAGNAPALIAARAVQGAGAALIVPLAMALLAAAFPPPERGKALGLFASITGLALILGPVLGGLIAEGAAWQWIFWLNLPIGVVLVPLVRRRVPESHGADTSIDIPGVVLVTGAALGIVWAVMRGNAVGWTSTEIVTAVIVGLLFGIGFVAWERRAAQPMVPMRLFGSRGFSSGVAAGFLFNAGMYGVIFLLPQFLQTGQGHGPIAAGLRLLPFMATLFVLAPIAGRLIVRVGERRLMVAGLALQALGMLWIGLIAAPDLPFAQLAPALILAGAGPSLAMPAVQNAVLNAVAKTEIGKAAGAYNMARFLGGVCGIALAGAVFAAVGGFESRAAFSAGFAAAMPVSAAMSLLGAVAALWQPGRRAALVPSEAKA